MPWWQPGDKPLSESMMVSLLMHIYESLILYELLVGCPHNHICDVHIIISCEFEFESQCSYLSNQPIIQQLGRWNSMHVQRESCNNNIVALWQIMHNKLIIYSLLSENCTAEKPCYRLSVAARLIHKPNLVAEGLSLEYQTSRPLANVVTFFNGKSKYRLGMLKTTVHSG